MPNEPDLTAITLHLTDEDLDALSRGAFAMAEHRLEKGEPAQGEFFRGLGIALLDQLEDRRRFIRDMDPDAGIGSLVDDDDGL